MSTISRLLSRLLQIFNFAEDRLQFVKDRPGHDRRYAVDWSKINRELGWEPEHSFKDWLQATVTWYQQNENWWRPLKAEAESTYKRTGQ